MGAHGLGAMARMVRGLAEVADAARSIRREKDDHPGRIDPRPPKSMVLHRDPAGRFEIQVPSTWQISNVGGVFARSREIGSFARVDIVGASSDVWAAVVHGLEKAGAIVTLKGRPVPSRVHGELELDGITFRWDALSYAVSDGVAVLSLGNVIDARRGKALEDYEDRMLAAIRRHFRALKPPSV